MGIADHTFYAQPSLSAMADTVGLPAYGGAGYVAWSAVFLFVEIRKRF